MNSQRPLGRQSSAPQSGMQRKIGGSKRVLVLDDDVLLLRSMKRLLSAHSITTTTTVEEALALIEHAEIPFDVILADVGMPERGGVELHIALAAMPSAPRFVFVTGGVTAPEAQQYIDDSGCLCLLKPASRFELLETIEGVYADANAA